MNQVRTRFAPSPTGSMHIGSLRTALFAYALGKHYKGNFILRIEDTDKKREVAGGVVNIKKILNTFDLNWDEYYVQSERVGSGIYKKAAEKLVSEGHAFYCQCAARNAKEEGFSKDLRDPCREKGLRKGAIKIKIPDGEKIKFTDYVLEKEIAWDTNDVPDTTLLKSDGFPTYHLAVVVDDTDMKITHVLRGHDWMPSTPIHLLLYRYLEYQIPEIGHLTDILDPEGGKLSKRKGSTSCEGLITEGYLPEAILNFVMLLGWAPKDNREFYTLDEFVNEFDPKGFQKSNPIFNKVKLDWFNGNYIRQTDNSLLKTKIFEFYKGKYPEDLIEKTTPLVKERISKLSEYLEIAGFFFDKPKVDIKLLGSEYKKHLEVAERILSGIDKFESKTVNEQLLDAVRDNSFKTGDFFMDLRTTLTGKRVTPPINESIVILGKGETLDRIKYVLGIN